MRIAAIYDIHGNLPALEAVLDEVRRAGVEGVVIGGDVVPGPMPREALAALRSLEIPVEYLRGNGEVAVLAEMTGDDSGDELPEAVRTNIRWTADQLGPEEERLLSTWPRTVRRAIDGLGDVLFCHATPRHENEIFTRRTAEENLRPLFDDLDVSTVVCGHTHMQFDRSVGRTRVVNAGSVGMPFGEPGAFWLELGPEIQFHRTAYDLADAAQRIRATSYPQAVELARDLPQPRSEEEMLEIFSNAELSSPS